MDRRTFFRHIVFGAPAAIAAGVMPSAAVPAAAGEKRLVVEIRSTPEIEHLVQKACQQAVRDASLDAELRGI